MMVSSLTDSDRINDLIGRVAHLEAIALSLIETARLQQVTLKYLTDEAEVRVGVAKLDTGLEELLKESDDPEPKA
jgi:hypothetical protein